MGITMQPDRFPEHRWQDPKRAAEARVFDVLQNLDLNGHGLYEFRYRREGQQVTTLSGSTRWRGSLCQ